MKSFFPPKKSILDRVFLQVILPPSISIGLFIFIIFQLLFPAMEEMVYERERDMIQNLTASVWSLLDNYHDRALSGELDLEEAQRRALSRIREIRYGPDMKDYFWINDLYPRMVMHPYRTDLDGQDLSDYTDPKGNRLFVTFVEIAKTQGEGFAEYLWDKQDETGRIVPKLSFVKVFRPWGWILGTGVYMEDVEKDIARTKRRLYGAVLGVFALLSALAGWMIRQGLTMRKQERLAQEKIERNNRELEESNERLHQTQSELRIRAAELAERNAQIERVNAELVQKNAELNDFTFIASHDLQEPLRKMIAFSDLLRRDLKAGQSERIEEDLGFIMGAAARMRVLVQDLLALSRTGRDGVKREPTSLRDCAERALAVLSERVEAAAARIEFDALPVVRGDRTLLEQLYQNLIGNALKFRGTEPLQIRLTAEFANGRPVYGVRDNGIGIKPEYARQIFVPFKRLHGQTEYEGTGIGLAICAKIVQHHGGTIWVESEPGRGSHFKFTLAEEEPGK